MKGGPFVFDKKYNLFRLILIIFLVSIDLYYQGIYNNTNDITIEASTCFHMFFSHGIYIKNFILLIYLTVLLMNIFN